MAHHAASSCHHGSASVAYGTAPDSPEGGGCELPLWISVPILIGFVIGMIGLMISMISCVPEFTYYCGNYVYTDGHIVNMTQSMLYVMYKYYQSDNDVTIYGRCTLEKYANYTIGSTVNIMAYGENDCEYLKYNTVAKVFSIIFFVIGGILLIPLAIIVVVLIALIPGIFFECCGINFRSHMHGIANKIKTCKLKKNMFGSSELIVQQSNFEEPVTQEEKTILVNAMSFSQVRKCDVESEHIV